jgi:hypothetical protein
MSTFSGYRRTREELETKVNILQLKGLYVYFQMILYAKRGIETLI